MSLMIGPTQTNQIYTSFEDNVAFIDQKSEIKICHNSYLIQNINFWTRLLVVHSPFSIISCSLDLNHLMNFPSYYDAGQNFLLTFLDADRSN